VESGCPGTCADHLVQFYGHDEARLVRNVSGYLSASLARGGAALIIASPPRRHAILAALHAPRLEMHADARIVALDDRETLGRFMQNGWPDASGFDQSVGACARELYGSYGPFRAYGEMVGRLWTERAFAAAIAVEGLWNELQRSLEFGLFCGYPIDVLHEDFQLGTIGGILATHTQMVAGLALSFDGAMQRAMDEVLGDHANGLRTLARGTFGSFGAVLPSVEQTILRLRSSLPRYADEILTKAREYSTLSA
jgi:hypothetical protein